MSLLGIQVFANNLDLWSSELSDVVEVSWGPFAFRMLEFPFVGYWDLGFSDLGVR